MPSLFRQKARRLGLARLRPLIGGSIAEHHGDLGLDRVGDEALLVRLVVKPRFLLWTRSVARAVFHPRMKHDLADPRYAVLILGHGPDRVVFIARHLESPARRQVQEGEQVTARNGRH